MGWFEIRNFPGKWHTSIDLTVCRGGEGNYKLTMREQISKQRHEFKAQLVNLQAAFLTIVLRDNK